jgi:hypothetical protein
VTRATVFVVVVFAAATAVAAAGIRPADQKLAERLTLQLSDFPSGWTTDTPPSTRLDKNHCATAPKVEAAITGYSDSAGFVPVHPQIDKRSAGSTTRVSSYLAAARAWYAWEADGAKSACSLKAAVASWKRDRPDFKVSRLRHLRESFMLHCSSCPAHRLSAWRWGFTISKQGQNDTTYVFDAVVVRSGRVVISLSFFSVDSPFGPNGQRLVAKLLERA